MDCQSISIYGKFVTSQTASFSREDINHAPSLFEHAIIPNFEELYNKKCKVLLGLLFKSKITYKRLSVYTIHYPLYRQGFDEIKIML